MIGTLFRLDPSIRGTWGLVLLGAMGGFLLRGLARRLPSDLSSLDSETSSWVAFAVLVAYLSCLLVLIFQNCGTRTSRFFVGLPVTARTLWWVRMTALLYVGTVPVLLATAVISLRFAAQGSGIHIEPFFLLRGGNVWTGLMLAAVLFQLPETQLQRIRPDLFYVLYVGFVSFVLIVFVSLAPASAFSSLLLLLVTIVLLIVLHRRMPQSFLLFPVEPDESGWEPGREAAEVPTLGDGSSLAGKQSTLPAQTNELIHGLGAPALGRAESTIRRYWSLHKTLARVLLNCWQSWLLAPMILFYSALLWDAYQGPRDPFANLLFITAWLFTLSYQVVIRLYRVDHLPISRRALFPYLFSASVLPVLVGAGAGMALIHPRDRAECKVCYGSQGIEVPPSFWEIAWDGKPPEVAAPWGETMLPKAYSVFPGSRVALYLPFETDESKSARFLAYQANRAVAAVNGFLPFDEDEIAEDAGNPLVGLMSRRQEFKKGFPIEQSIGRESPVRARTWMLGTVGVIWICGCIAVTWLLQFRPSRLRWLCKWLFWAMLGLWGGTLFMGLLGGLFRALEVNLTRFLLILVRHVAQELPLSLGGYWLAVFLSLGFFYVVLFAVFKGIEAPLGKVRPVWKEYG